MKIIKRHANILRVVMLGSLIGWCIKIDFLFPYLVTHAFKFPIEHPMFPSFFLNPTVSFVCFCLPVGSIVFIFWPTIWRLRAASILFVVCSFVLTVHINTYNDATYLTSFWVGLWMVWFSWNMDREDKGFIVHARVLAQCLVGMIFLGGFIGKLTPEYYAGEPFYHMFFVERGYPFHYWLVKIFSAGESRQVASVFSILIILSEFSLACTPLIPSRLAFIVAPCILTIFIVTNTYQILSVVGCIIGLLIGCLYSYRYYSSDGKALV